MNGSPSLAVTDCAGVADEVKDLDHGAMPKHTGQSSRPLGQHPHARNLQHWALKAMNAPWILPEPLMVMALRMKEPSWKLPSAGPAFSRVDLGCARRCHLTTAGSVFQNLQNHH